MNNRNSFHVIALAALGQGLSGGDRIFIELSRRFVKHFSVVIYVWEQGREMCRREKLETYNLKFKLAKVGRLYKLGFVFTYFYRIWLGLKLGLTLHINSKDYIYSASEFWMDSLPAFILKLRFPKITWVAAWYQTAPNPIVGFTNGRYRVSALLYWLAQLPIKPLIMYFADYVLVNNEQERLQFPNLNNKNKTIVVLGAVDTTRIIEYLESHKSPKKVYAAVFQGRFHPQKGSVELIKIWRLVVNKLPQARLVMIGGGPLEQEIKQEIEALDLKNNVDLVGYISDGPVKYKIFSQSQIVVHPAFYDSGGMASAEAMAFGLPCVGFDLPAYASYYPQGMLKIPLGNLEKFAQTIVILVTNKKLSNKIGKGVQNTIFKNWSWETRTAQVLKAIS